MPTFSHSKIETFRQCPRKYFYKYVERVQLPDVPEHVALFLGTQCHDALEWLYGQVMIGRVPSRDEVLDHLATSWESSWTDEIVISEAEMTPDDYRVLAAKCAGDYYDSKHPFDDATTIGLEKQIRFPLDVESDVHMVGYIDRLAKTADGTWHIHDYKTNRQLPTQADKDADPQLAYYEIGIRQMWPDSVNRVELHWHLLRFGESITSRRSPDQLDELRADALGTIGDAVGRGREENSFEPIESGLCRFCDYQSICPVRKHEFRVKGLPVDEYANETGVQLVNRWAELNDQNKSLKAQSNELERQIKKIQDALLAYAQRESVSTVAGDNFEATIRESDRVQLPRKTAEPDTYAQFEKQLRGSPIWEQASGIEAAQVRKLWERQDDLDAESRRVLAAFLSTVRDTRVRLRKR